MPTLQGRWGLKCPRCKSGGLFSYPNFKDKKYGPDNFYCESCDPYHSNPIKRAELEKLGILEKGQDPASLG